MSFAIWVDADSCPCSIRELILRYANRIHIQVFFVANHPIPFHKNSFCEMLIADNTPDAADDYIVDHISVGDLAVTRDIPLASRLVEKKIRILNDRGVVYSEANIRERLSLRNFMYDLRQAGIMAEKTTVLGKKEINAFANSLDREIQKLLRERHLDEE